MKVPHDLFKLTTADENTRGHRSVRATVARVATKVRIPVKVIDLPSRGII